jgi:hypothetical protein
MEANNSEYLRERARLSGQFNMWTDIVTAAIAGAITVMSPTDAESSTRLALGLTGAVAGVLSIEVILFVWRFVWVAPKTMHFELLKRLTTIERLSEMEIDRLHGELAAHSMGRPNVP